MPFVKLVPQSFFVIYPGEEVDFVRRAGRQPLAHSDATIICRTAASAHAVIAALTESNQRMIKRDQSDPMTSRFDYRSAFWQPASPGFGIAGRVYMSLAWYDEEFYPSGRAMWGNLTHRKMFEEAGILLNDITVTHWRRDRQRE